MATVLEVKKDGKWAPLPNPKSMEYALQDLDSEDGAGRNQKGLMFRDRVAVKRKLTCQWAPLNAEDMSDLLTAMKDTFFEIRFPDALTGERDSMTVYVGDRTAPMYTMHHGVWLWSGLSANFIER